MGARGNGIETREAGFALLIAIGFLLIVTAVITPFVLAARTALDTAAASFSTDRLRFVAEGLAIVIAHDVSSLPADEIARFAPGVRSDPVGCRSAGLSIEVRVQDQRGLIDLNAGDEAMLEAGLRALGLNPSDAVANARGIVAFRSSEEEDQPLSGADDVAIRAGPKKAAFEALEELQDFEALAVKPLAELRRIFTIHAGQAQIVGPRMPDALAEILPRRPAPGFPFIVREAASAGTFRIEVSVRASDATLGYAGLMASADAEEGKFKIVETSAGPTIAPDDKSPPKLLSCEALFGPAAALLRTFPA